MAAHAQKTYFRVTTLIPCIDKAEQKMWKVEKIA